jgi:hypothetical protein
MPLWLAQLSLPSWQEDPLLWHLYKSSAKET